MAFLRALFLAYFVLVLNTNHIAANGSFRYDTSPAITTSVTASGHNNYTYYSPRVLSTRRSILEPTGLPKVRTDHESSSTTEHDIASPTAPTKTTTAAEQIASIVALAQSRPYLEVSGSTHVALPTSQPSEQLHPDIHVQPSTPPDHDDARQDVHIPPSTPQDHDSSHLEIAISSSEEFLATATIQGSELAAHFTTDSSLVEILVTASVTKSKPAVHLISAPPLIIGDKTIEAGSIGVVFAGTTYSIASSGGAAGLVYVNGNPAAKTGVPGLSGGDSVTEVLSAVSDVAKGSGRSSLESSTLKASVSAGSTNFSSTANTSASSYAGTTVSTTSTTPALQSDASGAEALELPNLLLCMSLCGLALL